MGNKQCVHCRVFRMYRAFHQKACRHLSHEGMEQACARTRRNRLSLRMLLHQSSGHGFTQIRFHSLVLDFRSDWHICGYPFRFMPFSIPHTLFSCQVGAADDLDTHWTLCGIQAHCVDSALGTSSILAGHFVRSSVLLRGRMVGGRIFHIRILPTDPHIPSFL